MSASNFALSAVKKVQQGAPGNKEGADLEAQNKEQAVVESADATSPLLEPDEHLHFSQRAPWLRAGVLGATDGLVSVASLMIGVGGGSSALHLMILAGLAGLVGGALSMAVGEYISVASQKDAEQVKLSTLPVTLIASPAASHVERIYASYINSIQFSNNAFVIMQADIEKEKQMQAKGPAARQHELEELAAIYRSRGLSKPLAQQVAMELTEKDVIRAHARDELGIDIDDLSNPLKASVASAFAFLVRSNHIHVQLGSSLGCPAYDDVCFDNVQHLCSHDFVLDINR